MIKTMRPGGVVVWGAALLLAGAGAAAGQEIRAIELRAEGEVDVARVERALGVRVGDIYSQALADQAIQAVWRLGDVQAPVLEAVPLDGGIKLIVHVAALPRVADVAFVGEPPLAAEELLARLAHGKGSRTDERGFRADAEALRGLLREKGYPEASVAFRAEKREDGWHVTYEVRAGAPLRVGAIRFEFADAQSFSEAALLDRMRTRGPGWFRKGAYDPDTFQADLESVADFYRGNGFLDAQVTGRTETERGRLHPVVAIREGRRYVVDQVVVVGAVQVPEREILAALALRAGMPFSRRVLEKDLAAVRNLYGGRGFIQARIEEHLAYDPDRAALAVEIRVLEEGHPLRVRHVEIRGNDVTNDRVVRRYVSLVPGQVADASLLEKTRRRLEASGYFVPGSVDVSFQPSEQPDWADVIVEVDDSVRGRFTVGAAWHAVYGPQGRIEVAHQNFDFFDLPRDWRDLAEGTAFAGGGQKLSLLLAPGADVSEFRVSWTEPAVNDGPYSFGVDLYALEESLSRYEDYDESRRGGSFTVARRFDDDRLTISLTPGYERVKIDDIEPDAPADVFDAEGSHARHHATLGFAYDRRDHPLAPTEGWVAGLDLTMVGVALGGDVDALKERLRGAWYTTVHETEEGRRHVLSLRGELALIQDTGHDLPIFERYKAGGRGSIRGFEYNGIGPVDPVHQQQIGGKYRTLGGAEYEFPLYRDALRGVVFLDAGALAAKFGDLSKVRAAAGFGLRFDPLRERRGAPTLPIALDVAFPVLKRSEDETEAFSFSIGGGFVF